MMLREFAQVDDVSDCGRHELVSLLRLLEFAANRARDSGHIDLADELEQVRCRAQSRLDRGIRLN